MNEAKPLIGFLGCHRDEPDAQQQRDTWLVGSPVDHRYFIGRPGLDERPDVVWVDVDDGYTHLPFKTQAMCRWALSNGYTHLFKTDTDVYLRPERLLACGFEAWDYSGFFRGRAEDEPNDVVTGNYCSGGSGYWLSSKAMEIVAAAQMEENHLHPEGGYYCNGEDVQVGRLMREAGVPCHWDDRYKLRPYGPRPDNDYISLSDVVAPLRNGRMLKYHRDWKRGFK